MSKIKVSRLPVSVAPDDSKNPWYITCGYCTDDSFFGSLIAAFRGPRGKTWAAAFSWALEHARLHEQARCQTCGHVPSREDRPDKRYP